MRPLFSQSPISAAALALACCGLAVSACNGPASSLASNGVTPDRSQPIRPLAGSSATPSPIPYHFKTVDDPNSNFNEVTGINQLAKIVGVYGGGQSSNIYESYTSQGSYVKFRATNDPGAQGTFATALSSNRMTAGYVIEPNNLSGIWAFVRIRALWTLLQDPNEGSGEDAVTEILGINDSKLAVGFYVNPSGVDVPFELSVPTETFTNLKPPQATSAEATGINGKGDITGWEVTSKSTEGFFLEAGTYYQFSYPGAQATYPAGVNWSDLVVGSYVDGSGKAHGFVLTGPTRGGGVEVWQSVDEPNEGSGTWITGINNQGDICGYYVDGSGVRHGFVGTP